MAKPSSRTQEQEYPDLFPCRLTSKGIFYILQQGFFYMNGYLHDDPHTAQEQTPTGTGTARHLVGSPRGGPLVGHVLDSQWRGDNATSSATTRARALMSL